MLTKVMSKVNELSGVKVGTSLKIGFYLALVVGTIMLLMATGIISISVHDNISQ